MDDVEAGIYKVDVFDRREGEGRERNHSAFRCPACDRKIVVRGGKYVTVAETLEFTRFKSCPGCSTLWLFLDFEGGVLHVGSAEMMKTRRPEVPVAGALLALAIGYDDDGRRMWTVADVEDVIGQMATASVEAGLHSLVKLGWVEHIRARVVDGGGAELEAPALYAIGPRGVFEMLAEFR